MSAVSVELCLEKSKYQQSSVADKEMRLYSFRTPMVYRPSVKSGLYQSEAVFYLVSATVYFYDIFRQIIVGLAFEIGSNSAMQSIG